MHYAGTASAPAFRGKDVIILCFAGLALPIFAGLGLGLAIEAFGKPGDATGQIAAWIDGKAHGLIWLDFVVASTVLIVQVAVIQVLLLNRQGLTWQEFGFNAIEWHWLILGAVLATVLAASGEAIYYALGLEESATAFGRGEFAPQTKDWVTVSACMILFGPLTAFIEEAFFRGLVHRWMQQHMQPLLACLASSAFFALVHFYLIAPGGFLGLVFTAQVFVIGFVLAILFVRTGSLWPGTWLHAFFNIFAIAGYLVVG